MIAPLWRGVDRLVVECDAADTAIAENLCARARADAGTDSPWTVIAGGAGHRPVRTDAVLRLRLDGAVLRVAIERGIVIDESETGPAARFIQVTDNSGPALQIGIERALAAALPWRRTHHGHSRSRRS